MLRANDMDTILSDDAVPGTLPHDVELQDLANTDSDDEAEMGAIGARRASGSSDASVDANEISIEVARGEVRRPENPHGRIVASGKGAYRFCS